MKNNDLSGTRIKQKVLRILNNFHDFDEAVYHSAKQQVKEFNESEKNILLELLIDPSGKTRCDAAHALCILDSQKYLLLITPLLNDPLDDVRWFISGLLHDYGDTRAIGPLVQTVFHDPDGDVRHSACFALGEIGDENIILILQQVMESNQGTDNQGWPISDTAARAIRQIQDRLMHA